MENKTPTLRRIEAIAIIVIIILTILIFFTPIFDKILFN
jgi:hypothetical protein